MTVVFQLLCKVSNLDHLDILYHLNIFQFEADRRAFIITINSFGTELTKDDREKLYPTCGKLYPGQLTLQITSIMYEFDLACCKKFNELISWGIFHLGNGVLESSIEFQNFRISEF